MKYKHAIYRPWDKDALNEFFQVITYPTHWDKPGFRRYTVEPLEMDQKTDFGQQEETLGVGVEGEYRSGNPTSS